MCFQEIFVSLILYLLTNETAQLNTEPPKYRVMNLGLSLHVKHEESIAVYGSSPLHSFQLEHLI
jgi:hypothetical protein